MPIKLDLSKFKHVSSDNKTTTLKHNKHGHEITLVHKSLNRENQQQLAALSKMASEARTPEEQDAAKHGGYADGGPIDRTKSVAGGTVKGASGADITKPTTWFKDGGKVEKFCAYCGNEKHDNDCSDKDIKHYDQGTNYVTAATPEDQYDPSMVPEPSQPARKPLLPGDEGYDINQTNLGKAKNWVSKNMFPTDDDGPAADRRKAQAPPPPVTQAPVQTPEASVAPQPTPEKPTTPAPTPQPKQQAPQKPKAAPQQEITQAPQQDGPQTASPTPKTYADHVMDTKQDILQEGQHWQHDMENGHITPKTYNDLFHDRGTLGKIGMIFGMMASGMGAGLTHQPNAMLEMMNKQIENDLAAQQNSKTNAQNYLKVNQQDAMNKAQISNIGHNAKLTDAQARALNIESNAKAFDMMQITALHKLTQDANNLPPGPEKQAKEQALAMMSQAVQNGRFNLADKAAAGAAYYKMLNQQPGQGSQAGGNDPEEAFKANNNALKMLPGEQGPKKAEYNEQHHVPGYTQLSSRPVPEDTQKQILAHNVLDDKGKDLLNFINQKSGTWNPQDRKVATQKVEEMKNFYNDSIHGGALTEGRLGWYDEQFKKNPTDIVPQLLGNTKKLEEMVNSNAKRRDLLVKSTGIDPISHYNQQPQQSPQQPQANQPVKGKDGRMYIRQGNYMVPVK